MSIVKLLRPITFLVGVFVTMPIISVPILGSRFSMFEILFPMLTLGLWIEALRRPHRWVINHASVFLLIWFSWSLISTAYGMVFFDGMPAWQNNLLSYAPKLVVFSAFLILLYQAGDKERLVRLFLQGFLLGASLNVVWSIAEGVFYHVSGLALNNILFSGYLESLPANARSYLVVFSDGVIRSSGFNTDPAHIGGLAPVIFVYGFLSRKYSLVVLSLLSMAFSQSTTAVVASLASLIFIFFSFRHKKIRINLSDVSVRVFSFIFVTLIAGSFLLFYGIPDSVQNNVSSFYSRVNDVYLSNDSELVNPRAVYNFYILEAISFSGPSVLIGTGFGTASYPYLYNPELHSLLGGGLIFPYDPENTYISYLFDVGIIGLLIYAFVLGYIYFYFSRRSGFEAVIIVSSICGIAFSGLFYHYTLTAYQVLVLIFSVVLIRGKVVR